jgi:hypothetical protein
MSIAGNKNSVTCIEKKIGKMTNRTSVLREKLDDGESNQTNVRRARLNKNCQTLPGLLGQKILLVIVARVF